MAKFKVSNDVILNIGGLLLTLVPELIKCFGKKRDSEGNLTVAFPTELVAVANRLVPQATVKPDEIRKVAKVFEKLGDGDGGVFAQIADVLIAFKENGQAGGPADQHLDSAISVALQAGSAIGLLASELYTVADVWGK